MNPFKVEMYTERSKLEDEILSEIAPGFKIGRASIMTQHKVITTSDSELPPIRVEQPEEVNLFASDSSFADYFVGLPQQVKPSVASSSDIITSTTSNAGIANESDNTRTSLFSSSRPSLSTLMQSSSSVFHHSSASNSSSSSAISGPANPPDQEMIEEDLGHSRSSFFSLSDENDVSMGAVSFNEDVQLRPDQLDEYSDYTFDIHALQSDIDSQLQRDTTQSTEAGVYSRTMDGLDEDDEEEVKMPGFWLKKSSLADSLRESSAIDIIEDDRARLSFDDNIDSDDEPPVPFGAQAGRDLKKSKKRKRTGIENGDEGIESGDEQKESSHIVTSSNKRTVKKPKLEIFDELSSASAPVATSSKRKNYRKLNLKNGYKKPKMDRDMMSIAAARKRAEARTVVGPDLTPFDVIDESTMETMVPPLAVTTSEVKQSGSSENDRLVMSASRETVMKMLQNREHTYTEAEWKEACLAVLIQHFGKTDFREGQFEAIYRILQGKNSLLILPTGGGKSLCYQLPSLCFDGGITLVISPLLSLIFDQLTKLDSTSLIGVALTSTMTAAQTKEALEKLRTGQANILFVSPEKLASQNFLELFQLLALRINLLCVDEAHCVSTWSHNFRPSYLSIYHHAVETLGARCVLTLTATATALTRQSICDSLHVPQDGVLKYSPLGEHVDLNLKMVQEKQLVLEKILKSPELSGNVSVIVYVMFQKQADDVALYLQQRGFSTASYHAGKSTVERNRVQNLFLSHKVKILVATVAFGMGIDQRDIRSVIHYSLPKSVENYVQEVGRAGRDGEKAYCHLLFNHSDLLTLRSLAHADTQDRATIRSFILTLWPPTKRAKRDKSLPNRQVLLPISSIERTFDMKQSLITTIFSWLANDNKIIVRQTVDSKCEISFFEKSLEVLKSKSKLIRQCASIGTKSKSILTVPLATLAQSRSTNIEELKTQLNEAAEKLHLTLTFKEPSFNLEIIDELLNEDDLDTTIDTIVQKIKQLEAIALNKLDALYRIATQDLDQSIHSKLKKYFDSETPTELTPPTTAASKLSCHNFDSISSDVKFFISQFVEEISTARQVARIFHGISSPQFPKEEWQRNQFWGSAISTPFEVILQIAQEELIALMTL